MQFEIDMTPEEARKVMGLPDVSALQEKMMGEMERRMMAAMKTSDPEAMMRAWMPLGGQAFEQFQKFMWDGAKMAAGRAGPKKESK
ncbi:MAG TPA: DUF6489 family protein [Rhizomicrobium sp.]|nr:DUF6489 family protein [Rhizomicrobium sp.]